MRNDKDFQRRIEKVGDLVRNLDTIADPAIKARANELVQLILDLHAEGLERVLETVARHESGQRIIDDLGGDSLVSSLLVLYGLHPLDFESRVARAVEKLQPQIHKNGGEVELVAVADGNVRVRASVSSQGCGSTTKTVKSLIEDAIYDAAPDIGTLEIDGLEERTGSASFVPLSKVGGLGATAVLK